MKAVSLSRHGDDTVLQVAELPDPLPGLGEVQLDVLVCGLNRWDVDVCAGTAGLPIELPFIPGYEVVGVVAAVGAGVTGWSVGDRAMANLTGPCGGCEACREGSEPRCDAPGWRQRASWGGLAEKVVCRASELVHTPPELSDAEAAALQVAFGTAWRMLFTRGRLAAGDRVLVNCVGGAVSGAAVQLAHVAGATVIGTASDDAKLASACGIGMDHGINYRRRDIADAVAELTDGRGVDLVIHGPGAHLLYPSLEALGPGGTLVVFGSHAGDSIRLDLPPLYQAQKAIVGSSGYGADEMRQVLALVRSGKVRVPPPAAYTFSRVRDAMAALERRDRFGKIVLTADDVPVDGRSAGSPPDQGAHRCPSAA